MLSVDRVDVKAGLADEDICIKRLSQGRVTGDQVKRQSQWESELVDGTAVIDVLTRAGGCRERLMAVVEECSKSKLIARVGWQVFVRRGLSRPDCLFNGGLEQAQIDVM